MLKRKRWLIAGILALVVGGGSWFTYSRLTGAQAANSGTLVQVAAVRRQDVEEFISAAGTVAAETTVEIQAPFDTASVRLLVDEGETVKAGQVLAELNTDQQQSEVSSQEAALAKAESSLAQLLKKEKTEPLEMQRAFEQAQVSLLQAQESLKSALASVEEDVADARSSLLQVQSKSAGLNADVGQKRTALEQAESRYRANPLDAAARQAYDEAQAAYEEALREANQSARQLAIEMAKAQEALEEAEANAEGDGSADPVAVQQARSNLRSAQISLETARINLEEGSTLSEQIRASQLDLAAARDELVENRNKLSQAKVTAPSDAVVMSVAVTDGKSVQEKDILLTLGVVDQLAMTIRVDEVDVGKVKIGQPVTVTTNAYPSETFAGEVVRIAAQATQQSSGNSSTSYYEVKGLIQNPDGKLKAGMTGEASIAVDARTGVLAVALDALREDGPTAEVLMVKDGVVEVRPVKTGLRTDSVVEITEGVNEGEQVIVSPYSLIRTLQSGDTVTVGAAGRGAGAAGQQGQEGQSGFQVRIPGVTGGTPGGGGGGGVRVAPGGSSGGMAPGGSGGGASGGSR